MSQKLLNTGIVLLAVGLLQACNAPSTPQNNSPEKSNAGQAGSANGSFALYEGVRMSRAFFEKNLSGSIKVQGADDQNPLEVNSGISMELRPQEGPAPAPGYIADFRDQKSCANYKNTNGATLCFTVSPDVSSFDVNGKKVALEGIERIAEDHLNAQASSGCNVTVKNVRYSEVAKSADGFKVTFVADQKPNPECAQGSAPKSVLIEVGLQSL